MVEPSEEAKKALKYPGIPLMLLLWAVVGALAYARHYLQDSQLGHHNAFWPEFLTWLACFCPWAVLAPAVFRLERQYCLGGKRSVRNFVLLAFAGLILGYVAYQITLWASVFIQRSFAQPLTVPRPLWGIPKGELFLEQFLFWATLAASYIIRRLMTIEVQEREKADLRLEKSRLEASLKQAELETLRLRLNPHFLFNTLQNISVLAAEEPQTASQMLTRLGDLLRTALRSDCESVTRLDAEIGLAESYVAVEKMRFGNRLNLVVDLAPGTSDALVPTLLLQPLVENAIKHGMNTSSKSGVLTVRSKIEHEQLVITVSDNGRGLACANLNELELGIGLGSTLERMARMYGEEGELTLRSLPEGGAETRVRLPLRCAVTEKGGYEQTSPSHR